MDLNQRVALLLGELQLRIIELQVAVETLTKKLEEAKNEDAESELP